MKSPTDVVDSARKKDSVLYQAKRNTNSNIARGAFGEITLAALLPNRVSTAAPPPTTSAASNKPPHEGSASPRLVAIKRIYLNDRRSKNDNDAVDVVVDEIACLQRLQPHANIVRLWDALPPGAGAAGFWSLILPYCPVDLHTVLEWKRLTLAPPLSERTLFRLASHLFAALQHCHDHGIVHNDVKPGNLLVHVESATLQLCDFGIAMAIKKDSADSNSATAKTKQSEGDEDPFARRQPTALCTLQYRPPELLLGLVPDQAKEPWALDMFAAGISLADCVAGHMLFPGTNDLSQLSLYFSTLGTPGDDNDEASRLLWPSVVELPDWGKLTFAPRAPNAQWHVQKLPRLVELSRSRVFTDIMVNTIQLDPSKRWSAQRCREHLLQTGAADEPNPIWFAQELVPPSLLQTPLLLTPPATSSDPADDEHPALDAQLQSVAQTRREFLSSLHPWNKKV